LDRKWGKGVGRPGHLLRVLEPEEGSGRRRRIRRKYKKKKSFEVFASKWGGEMGPDWLSGIPHKKLGRSSESRGFRSRKKKEHLDSIGGERCDIRAPLVAKNNEKYKEGEKNWPKVCHA